ncbi:hypothetical protein [Kineococcus rhizosphaerae]|nr:hypothetical protein [Kineococcus rhizosphaerae]
MSEAGVTPGTSPRGLVAVGCVLLVLVSGVPAVPVLAADGLSLR